MKRKIFAALAISAIAFVSCKKEEPVAPAGPGSATVSGTLWANSNLDNDTDNWGFYMYVPEYAKAGATITAVVDGYDLDPTPDGSYDYPEVTRTTTIGSNGAYSFTDIPCYDEIITVELRFNDYNDQQLSGGVIDPSVTYYMGGSQYVQVWRGAVVMNDYTFNY
ncbi:MAG: hypothetical protein HYZ14_18925 [Bacteroidetes bacterium]|nr:hypothetical protein [Bacteroidota bacterium]